MGTLTFYDAAYPPADPPATAGVVIYIGGDTPHVWTAAEIAAQPARYRLPCFVRSDPASASALVDAGNALAALARIGAPAGCLVALDTETAADPAYAATFYSALHDHGYALIDYGSQDALFANDIPDGYYWGADWTGTPHIAPGDQMTQYASFTDYDLSLATSTLPFWDTRPSPITWQETDMQQLPTIAAGATGTAVRTAQGLAVARGAGGLAVDGIFGPLTAAAVERIQAQARIAVDGIVGPQTWPVLMGVAQ